VKWPQIKKNVFRPWIWILVFFTGWMFFLDENHVRLQYHRSTVLEGLNEKRRYYIRQINQIEEQHRQLVGNPAMQERFARECFFMKRDGEDVFVVQETDSQ
jgi:cell division protein DivIC